MNKPKSRILIVEDEPRYVRAIKFNLEASGYHVLVAGDGEKALDLVCDETPDLILLDVRLPGMDGFEVCRQIRQSSAVPIIMLTALAEDRDMVAGLDSGADDYIAKPFGAEELLARIRALLRRVDDDFISTQDVLVFGSLKVDFKHNQVWVNDRNVFLTPIEYRLFAELVIHRDQVLVPSYLLERVWGTVYSADNHLLWQAIYRLRKKIEIDAQSPRMILTRAGIGYTFLPPS